MKKPPRRPIVLHRTLRPEALNEIAKEIARSRAAGEHIVNFEEFKRRQGKRK